MEELPPSDETICPTLDVHPSIEVLEQYVVPPMGDHMSQTRC
jgi:hypothetical protein